MKKSEIKATLLDLGVDAETINKIAGSLTTSIGESNSKLLERKKEEWKKEMPKAEDLITKQLKENGFESFEELKKMKESNTNFQEKFKDIAIKEKNQKFSTAFDTQFKELQIEDKYKPLVSKFIDKDKMFNEEGDIDVKALKEATQNTIDQNFEGIIVQAVKNPKVIGKKGKLGQKTPTDLSL